MKNTYWNNNGKHQEFADHLSDLMPSQGYTSNVYMNLFIALSHLYYNVHNDGGVDECFNKEIDRYVAPYLPDISMDDFESCNYRKIEQHLDKALEYLKDKPMDFPVYYAWVTTGKESGMSLAEPPKELLDSGAWMPVTFGNQETLHKWSSYRGSWDKDHTKEFEALNMESKSQLPALCFTVIESTGELACIKKGIEGYFKSEWSTDSPEKNREIAAYMNSKLEITEAQVKAMEAGSMFGWDKPLADPKAYLKSSLQEQIAGAQQRKEPSFPDKRAKESQQAR